ncbi:hypothetical protein VPAL9027_01059 [Vibrio palustris]|uniref:Uncharacterized protein n=1 Tax=Vibrio palustris TaxID=1918946 RepID=A0A1R4B2G2_9VIBR|nr:hypothetical protein VPAL9027_01059 [Vibrio palustris]
MTMIEFLLFKIECEHRMGYAVTLNGYGFVNHEISAA